MIIFSLITLIVHTASSQTINQSSNQQDSNSTYYNNINSTQTFNEKKYFSPLQTQINFPKRTISLTQGTNFQINFDQKNLLFIDLQYSSPNYMCFTQQSSFQTILENPIQLNQNFDKILYLHNKIYLINKDLLLGQIINNTLYTLNLQKTYNLNIQDSLTSEVFLFYAKNLQQIIIINKEYVIQFQINQIITNQQNSMIVTRLETRRFLLNFVYDEDSSRLLLALGLEGVDCYKIKTNELLFIKNFDATNLQASEALNIVDIYIQEIDNTQFLYLLDYNNGIFILNLHQLEYPSFIVPSLDIPRCSHLAVHRFTLEMICKTKFNDDLLIEAFIQPLIQEFKVNNYQLLQMDFKDLFMDESLLIVQGFEQSLIMEHSIPKKLFNQYKRDSYQYVQTSHVKHQFIYKLSDDNNTREIKILQLEQNKISQQVIILKRPSLVCSFHEFGDYEIGPVLQINKCNGLQSDLSLEEIWEQCTGRQELSFVIEKVYLTDQARWFTTFFIVLGSISTLVFLLIMIKKYFNEKRQIKFVQYQLDSLREHQKDITSSDIKKIQFS